MSCGIDKLFIFNLISFSQLQHANKQIDKYQQELSEKKMCSYRLQECQISEGKTKEQIKKLNANLEDCEIDVNPLKTLLFQIKKNSEMMEACAKDKPFKKVVIFKGVFSSSEDIEERPVSPFCNNVALDYQMIFDGISNLIRQKGIKAENSRKIS